MRDQCRAAAIISLGLSLLFPLVASCEWVGEADCSMSSCPMATPVSSPGCHSPDSASAQESSDCEFGDGLVPGVCFLPAGHKPARLDSSEPDRLEFSTLGILSHHLVSRPPERPELLALDTVFAGWHEQDRFKLLSTYLL